MMKFQEGKLNEFFATQNKKALTSYPLEFIPPQFIDDSDDPDGVA